MTLDQIRKILRGSDPFSSRMVSGRKYRVGHPDYAPLGQSDATLVFSDDKDKLESLKPDRDYSPRKGSRGVKGPAGEAGTAKDGCGRRAGFMVAGRRRKDVGGALPDRDGESGIDPDLSPDS